MALSMALFTIANVVEHPIFRTSVIPEPKWLIDFDVLFSADFGTLPVRVLKPDATIKFPATNQSNVARCCSAN